MAEVDTMPDAAVIAADDAQDQVNDHAQELVLAQVNNEVAAPTEKKVKKIIRRKKRPARPQIDPDLIKSEPPPQTGTVFNIWYNKWSGGDREDKYLSQTQAKGRCNIALDSGYTRADSRPGSYFCLFFARGIWYAGMIPFRQLLSSRVVTNMLLCSAPKVRTANICTDCPAYTTCSTPMSTVSGATSSATTAMIWAVLEVLLAKIGRSTLGGFM